MTKITSKLANFSDESENFFRNSEELKRIQKLASYLGKEVKSSFMVDKGTKQYLVGLEYTKGIEGWSHDWIAKIRFTCNGYTEEKWINLGGVKI